MRNKKHKWFIRVLLTLLALFILISAVPYLIPVTTASSERTAPFPESAFTTIDGVLIHYRIWKTDATIYKGKALLVHGLGGSTFSWRKNVDALTGAGYFVMAVDLPGFGYSDRKKGINHSQESRSVLLWKLLSQVDNSLETKIKDDSWNLVGHSMGGGTVTAMALANQIRTRSIVLVDAAVLVGDNSLALPAKYPPVGRWLEILGRKMFLNSDKVSTFLASAYGSTPLDNEVDGYLQPLLLEGTEGAFIDVIRTTTTIKEGLLKKIAIPVAAIWGGQDSWIPLTEAQKLKTILPSMNLEIITEATHCPMETHSELFNKYLIESLGKTG